MCLGFTVQELSATASELRGEIHRLFKSARTNKKPDILLGSHPAVYSGSALHSVAIWHGKRIEQHFGEWVGRIPAWSAKTNRLVQLPTGPREIDNLVANQALGIVLAVETKRDWGNQDSGSVRDVNVTHTLFDQNKISILTAAGCPKGDFRHFVFDVYGGSPGGTGALPIVSGDKIANVFGSCLWAYLEWERAYTNGSGV